MPPSSETLATDGRAVEVFYSQAFDRALTARCDAGHVWSIDAAEIEDMRARVSLVSWRRAENIDRMIRDCPHVLECPICKTLARAASMALLEDPDRLRVEGAAE